MESLEGFLLYWLKSLRFKFKMKNVSSVANYFAEDDGKNSSASPSAFLLISVVVTRV